MARLLALEWDDAEARAAVAETRAGRVVLQQAFAVALPKASGEASGAADAEAIGRCIGETLADRGVRRVDTLVAVGRANIELRNLTLPPAPPEELPEMVRFQAEREFNALADDWALDFIPMPGEAGGAQTVLAAAISPELVGEIKATCAAAQLSPRRLVLRPCGAASLLARSRPSPPGQLQLLVDLLADEADLTVLSGDTVVFLRTTRLQTETFEREPLRAIVPEVRRTIAAVHNRFQGQRIAKVYLCGAGADQEQFVHEVGRELDIPAELFNPLAACSLDDALQHNLPQHPSRYAPLLGMLLDEAAGESNTLDFLNPRQPPAPRVQRKPWVIGAAVAAVLLLAFGWRWAALAGSQSEIDRLQAELNRLNAEVSQAAPAVRQAAQIDAWLADDKRWLDELAQLASQSPPAQDFKLTYLQGNSKDGTGTLSFGGIAGNLKVLQQLPGMLTDPRRQARLKSQEQLTENSKWTFSGEVRLLPEAPEGAAAGRTAGPAQSSAPRQAPAPTGGAR